MNNPQGLENPPQRAPPRRRCRVICAPALPRSRMLAADGELWQILDLGKLHNKIWFEQ